MKCDRCHGQGIVVRERPEPLYGGQLTRFASQCPAYHGRGRVEYNLDSRLLAASGDDTRKEPSQ